MPESGTRRDLLIGSTMADLTTEARNFLIRTAIDPGHKSPWRGSANRSSARSITPDPRTVVNSSRLDLIVPDLPDPGSRRLGRTLSA